MSDTADELNDRSIIDIIKENIVNERIRNEDYISFLKGQIDNYIVELSQKNEQIPCLLKLLENVNFDSTNKKHMETIQQKSNSENSCKNTVGIGNDVESHRNVVNDCDNNTRLNPSINSQINEPSCESNNNGNFNIDSKWITERKKVRKDIPLHNTYEPLMQLVGNENKNDVGIHEDDVIHETTQRESIRKRENANVYVNQHPERDVLLLKNRNQRNEHKGTVVILSDSIAKGINTTKFNNQQNNDTMIKRVYPGATASRVNHYVTATITEDKPEKIVICAGTNTLTKKEQTPRDTVNEIMDIVETCKKGGI